MAAQGFYATDRELFYVTASGRPWMLSDYATATDWLLFKKPGSVASLPRGASRLPKSWLEDQPNRSRLRDKVQMIASANLGDLSDTTGRFFVIVNKKNGQAVNREIYRGSADADDALAQMGGERQTGYQVMDAMWHNPSRAKLKAMGWIGGD